MSNTGEVGRLSAALTLDGAEQFQQKLQQVGQTFTETTHKGSAFGRAGEQAVRTAAGATTALTTAAAAYLTILTKTGVAYNSLQQNSRAALSVMLGGAEQANAQMDKLDAFARNSPFAKDVFVSAQQQMLGFGIEASKVIPYLDAIQNAVAATGGNSARVGELSLIMSQIRSSAKITATDLREFGNRGVDAAAIIGAQMGKTAAQIRDDISDGALDAQVALDMLAKGMQETYGGTTELVKQQWTGAVDRVKAANRDLGAAIAEPFVSQQGGGMAVRWANQVADVLRAVERQAAPVMEILTVRGSGAFTALTQGLDRAQMSIDRFDPERVSSGLDRLAGHAPGVAALAGAVLALGANVGPLGRMFSILGLSINPVVAAVVGLSAASPELRGALMDLLETGKPLLPVLGEMATIASGTLSTALPVVADGIGLVVSVAKPLVEILASIPAPVLLGVAAFLALHRVMTPLEGGLKSVSDVLRGFTERAALQAALGQTSTGIGAISAASMSARGGVVALGTALKTAFLSNPIGIALTVVSAAVGVWAMANASAQQKVEEHRSRVEALRGTLNQTTGALTEASEAQVKASLEQSKAAELADQIGVKYSDVEQAALGNAAAQDRVNEAMARHRAEAGNYVSDMQDAKYRTADLSEIIEGQRSALEDAQRATREKIQADRDAAAAMTDAARSNQRFNDALQVARDITQDAETRVRALKQALDELKGGSISAEEAQKRLSETNLTLAEGLAQTDEAGAKLWQTTLDGAGKIDIGSRAGLAFADSMSRSRDAMLNAAMAASDQALANGDLVGAVAAAREAGESYISTLRATMEDAGLTKEQIDGLVGSYLDVPGVVATILTDNGTISEVDQQVLALAMQLDAVPDGKAIEVTDPGNPEVIRRLEEAGVKVEQIPGSKNIHISQTGADVVAGVLDRLSETRHATVLIHQVLTGRANSVEIGNSNGGLYSGRGRHFADGGFASGIYAGVMGGIPKMGADGVPHLFAEKHLGVDWETYISSRASRERNAMLLLETARRIGFPVVPLSALQGIRGYADGGSASRGSATSAAASFGGGSVTNWNITQMYPQNSDPMQDMADLAEELSAERKGGM